MVIVPELVQQFRSGAHSYLDANNIHDHRSFGFAQHPSKSLFADPSGILSLVALRIPISPLVSQI